MYRRGQAELKLKNYDEAFKDLSEANKLLPDNKNILMEFDKIKKLRIEYNDKQKILFKKLFD